MKFVVCESPNGATLVGAFVDRPHREGAITELHHCGAEFTNGSGLTFSPDPTLTPGTVNVYPDVEKRQKILDAFKASTGIRPTIVGQYAEILS